jgi:DinB superfamily
MRHLAAVAALLFVVSAPATRAGPLTAQERQHLVAHLEMTGSWLEDELSALSTDQLGFRRAPDAWTILEVFDHLVVVGPIYWKDLQAARPAANGRGSWMSDADVLWYGIDRAHRETALKTEEPRRQPHDLRAGLIEYRKQHAQLLHYIRTTTDDLRSRYVERQRCDAYQWALLISTHEQRHILQIREIKADPNYPKK